MNPVALVSLVEYAKMMRNKRGPKIPPMQIFNISILITVSIFSVYWVYLFIVSKSYIYNTLTYFS
jgi:hypothetical protein